MVAEPCVKISTIGTAIGTSNVQSVNITVCLRIDTIYCASLVSTDWKIVQILDLKEVEKITAILAKPFGIDEVVKVQVNKKLFGDLIEICDSKDTNQTVGSLKAKRIFIDLDQIR